MKPDKEHPPPENLITTTLWVLLRGVLATPILGVTFLVTIALIKLAPGGAYVWLALWLASILFLWWWLYRVIDRTGKRLQKFFIEKVTYRKT